MVPNSNQPLNGFGLLFHHQYFISASSIPPTPSPHLTQHYPTNRNKPHISWNSTTLCNNIYKSECAAKRRGLCGKMSLEGFVKWGEVAQRSKESIERYDRGEEVGGLGCSWLEFRFVRWGFRGLVILLDSMGDVEATRDAVGVCRVS